MNEATRDTPRVAFATILAIVLGGCAAGKPVYDGPLRSPEYVSIVRVTDGGRIFEVDGRVTNYSAVEVLPGRHFVHFRMETDSDKKIICRAEVVTVANHRYDFVRTGPLNVELQDTTESTTLGNTRVACTSE